MRAKLLFLVAALAAAIGLLACNELVGLREPITAEDDAGPDAPFVPAPHPAPPTFALRDGGSPLRTATVVPISFPTTAFTSDLDGLVAHLDAAGYWDKTVKEYGVTSVTAGTPIALSEAAPDTIDDPGIQKWLAAGLTSDAGPFGPPSPTTVYMLLYPANTTISLFGSKSCNNFNAYHNNFVVAGVDVAYEVVAGCNPLDWLGTSMTSELIGALTDPHPSTSLAIWGVDRAHAAWGWNGMSGEVGTMCYVATSNATVTPSTLGHAVFRGYSSEAALAGHNPCVPTAPSDGPYFNSAAVVSDQVTGNYGVEYGHTTTTGVLIPRGQSRTIPLALWSDAPTTGPWTVTATTNEQDLGTGPGYLTFSLDRATGSNGDVLHLTINVAADAKTNGQTAVIASTLGGITNYWYVAVGN